jgi:hypothetical protein
MAPILWQYEDEADGNWLTLDSEGPRPSMPRNFRFRNTWEFESKDRIVLTSETEDPGGRIITIMKSTCVVSTTRNGGATYKRSPTPPLRRI